MKIISKLTGIAAIAVIALTGCSQPQEKYPEPPAASTEVANTVHDFYVKSVDSAPAAVKSFDKGPTQMAELLSPEDVKKLNEAPDPFTGLDNISHDGQVKVAKFYRDLDPVGDFYSYDGLNDSQKAGVSLTSLVSTTFLSSPDVAAAAKSVGVGNVTLVDDTHAKVNFKAGVDVDQSGSNLYLVKTDAGWKIDGKKTYEQYLADMKKN